MRRLPWRRCLPSSCRLFQRCLHRERLYGRELQRRPGQSGGDRCRLWRLGLRALRAWRYVFGRRQLPEWGLRAAGLRTIDVR